MAGTLLGVAETNPSSTKLSERLDAKYARCDGDSGDGATDGAKAVKEVWAKETSAAHANGAEGVHALVAEPVHAGAHHFITTCLQQSNRNEKCCSTVLYGTVL